jgi:hypothetical protein
LPRRSDMCWKWFRCMSRCTSDCSR